MHLELILFHDRSLIHKLKAWQEIQYGIQQLKNGNE